MSELPAAAKPLMSRKSGALQGAVPVPGDKSISHRALILGALAEGRTEIAGLLESEDILCTAKALQSLGAHIEKANGIWTVIGIESVAACGEPGGHTAILVNRLANRANDWVAHKIVEFTAAILADPLVAALSFRSHPFKFLNA